MPTTRSDPKKMAKIFRCRFFFRFFQAVPYGIWEVAVHGAAWAAQKSCPPPAAQREIGRNWGCQFCCPVLFMTQPKALPLAVPGERPMKNRGHKLHLRNTAWFQFFTLWFFSLSGQVLGPDLKMIFQWLVGRFAELANHDIFLAGYLWKLCAGVDLTPANLSKIQQLDSRGI